MLIQIAKPKINDFDAVIMIKKQVLRLQVPMNYTQLMNILYTRDYLLVHFGCLLFF